MIERDELRRVQVKHAVALYKIGKLRLDDVQKSEWRSYVSAFLKEDPNNEDLAVLAAITHVLYLDGLDANYHTVDVGVDPAQVKAAQWYCKQNCSLIIRNVSSAADLQTLLVSSANRIAEVKFEQVMLSASELPKALRNQGPVYVTYNAREDSIAIGRSANVRPQLIIESVADKNKKNEAHQKIEQLIKGFSQNGDFGLTLENETFDPSLDLSISGLREVFIRGALFTNAHIDCLRQIPALKLEKLILERCNFKNDEVKQTFFTFLVTLPSVISLNDARLQDEYRAFRKKYDAEQALFQKALDYVKGMITRVEDDENDLHYEEFSILNCKAILALEEKNPELCRKPAFKKLFAIASIITKRLINISDEGILQSVIWFIRNHNGPLQFVVNSLQNEQYFSDLVQEMKNSERQECVRFVNLKVSGGAVAEYLQLGHASVSYFAQEKVFTLVPLKAASSKSAVSVFNFRGVFSLDTLQRCVEVTKGKVEFSFSGHNFLPTHVEYLTSLPEEKLVSVNFDDECEYSPEAKACLFEKGEVLMLRASPTTAIHKEYVQYLVACAQRDRIKSLIARYKNNTLQGSELMRLETKQFIMAFDHDKQKELTADEKESLADLFQIVTFNREVSVVISDDKTFRIVRWMLSHVDERLPSLHVRNVEEACALIEAQGQNTKRCAATIKLAVSDAHSVEMNCSHNRYVTVRMKGQPQGAEVFNRIINTISSEVNLELGKDQFLPDMDLSNPRIDTIMLRDLTGEQPSLRFIISAKHVEALGKTRRLRFFLAAHCDFDSSETKEGFVDALLANENLEQLALFDCGLTKKHLAKLTAYAKSHPGLIEVTLGANAYREGEDKELMAIVRANKAQTDKKKAREEACNTLIHFAQISDSTFEETKKRLNLTIDRLKDFYVEPACVAAYVEALKEFVKKMSFSDGKMFTQERVGLDQLLSRCIDLSAENRQKVLDAMVASAVVSESLSDTVLIHLMEQEYTNAALLECQRKRFDALERELFTVAVTAKEFSAAQTLKRKMSALVCPTSPLILFQKKYDVYLRLADLYAASNYLADNLLFLDVLWDLSFIPPSEKRMYALAQEKVRKVVCKKIREILLSDIRTEKPTQFQDRSLRELEEMANNPKIVLQDVQVWMNKFIDDSSRIPFRDNYITNRGNKVEKLEQLRKHIQQFIRPPEATAPAKEKSDAQHVLDDVLAKEKEHKEGGERGAAASVYPSVITPPIGQPFPHYVRNLPAGAPIPVAPPPEPVEYPPRLPKAQLMNQQRRAEAAPVFAPVLQGVSPAPAPSAPQREEAAAAPAKRVQKKTPMLE